MGLTTSWTLDRIHFLDRRRLEDSRIHRVPRVNHFAGVRAFDQNPVQPILAVLEPLAFLQGEFRTSRECSSGLFDAGPARLVEDVADLRRDLRRRERLLDESRSATHERITGLDTVTGKTKRTQRPGDLASNLQSAQSADERQQNRNDDHVTQEIVGRSHRHIER